MAEQGGAGHSLLAVMRDYRKGNWTVTETMVLIEAKKMDDERRTRIRAAPESGSSGGGGVTIKPSEPRWKWVEDYCWRKGCFRSQNQCNDKWDNLMRDYKKVRDYERRRRSHADGGGSSGEGVSYWKMDKAERKDRNLPTNFISQIYDSLVDVVERRPPGVGGGASMAVALPGIGSASALSHHPALGGPGVGMSHHHQPVPMAVASSVLQLPPPPLPPQHALPPLPSPVVEAAQQPHSFPTNIERAETSDSGTNENSHSSPAKRRRIAGNDAQANEGTMAAAAGASKVGRTSYEAAGGGSAVSRGASIIAEALQACDEREERRHMDLISIQERRLKLEESNAETNRRGIDGLIEAINKLADSIQVLAAASSSGSSKNQSSSSHKI